MLPPKKKTESLRAREARESTEALERRMGPSLTLGQRDMITARLNELAHELIAAGQPEALVERYQAMHAALAAQDAAEFGALRARLRAGTFTPAEYREALATLPQHDWDGWTRRIFELHQAPPTTVALTAEMVGYVTTHVVQILEMVSELTPDDVYYDLGSGIGFVPILASWLSGARAVGVELEPAFVAMARERAEQLGLAERVRFVEADLREVDYADATAVFMFYPCRGQTLEQVIDRLEPVGRTRALKLYSLGLSGQALVTRPWVEIRGQSPSALLALATVPGAPAAVRAPPTSAPVAAPVAPTPVRTTPAPTDTPPGRKRNVRRTKPA
jgi:SAM-dependent methyltransferase